MPIIVRTLAEAGARDISFEQLVSQLEASAADNGPWLVVTPLANVSLEDDFIAIDERSALIRPTQDQDWQPWESTDDTSVHMRRHFKDWVNPKPRWLHANTLLGADLDTRHGGALATIEFGTVPVALDSARTKTRYALAVWTALRAPDRNEIWPSVGYWAPQPYLDVGQPFKELQPELFVGRARTESRTIHTREYALPSSPAELALPFELMDAAPHRHSARALLSSSWSFHCAMRFPSEIEMTDRLFGIYTAVASLCEKEGVFDDKTILRRWRAARTRFEVWEELVRSGSHRDDLEEAEKRLSDVRNIAAHGADSVLVNLGYPAERTRFFRGGREMPGDYLALSVLYSELHPLQWAIRRVLQNLLPAMSKARFADEVFDQFFAAP